MMNIKKLTLSSLLVFIIMSNSTISFDKENKLNKKNITNYSTDYNKHNKIKIVPQVTINTINEDSISTTSSPTLHSETQDNRKLVALTFDDGPSAYTDEILDLLKKYDIKATFFVLKYSCEYYPDNLVRIAEEGHEIAIHGATHKSFADLSTEQINEEIASTIDYIKELGITPTELVRPPYGAINNEIIDSVNYPFIIWNIDTKDWKTKDKEKIEKQILDNIKDGSIILMHNTESAYESTSSALDEILPDLINEYRFVTVSELFQDNDIQLEKNKVYYNIKK